MSGWLHPEGPETAGTYWWRRTVVIAAAIVLLVLGASLVGRMSASGTEPSALTQAEPAPVTTAPTAPPPSESPSPSTSATPSSSSSATPSSSSSATPSSSSSATPSSSSSATPTAEKSSTPTPSRTPVCDAEDLRATLRGNPSPKVGQAITFQLSLINGSASTCTVTRNAETMELKVYSGTDRIWSTADCAEQVPSVNTDLKAQQATTWTMSWNGKRSKDGCGTRSEQPKAGTYFATFAYDGSKPVQQRMVLR